jgi:hypothetical protein
MLLSDRVTQGALASQAQAMSRDCNAAKETP